MRCLRRWWESQLNCVQYLEREKCQTEKETSIGECRRLDLEADDDKHTA